MHISDKGDTHPPQSQDAFLSGDPVQCVKHTGVAATFSWRQSAHKQPCKTAR